MMKKIHTNNAPTPAGHYSQAVSYQNLLFISGQLPIDHVDGAKITGPIEEQTKQVLKNLEAILLAGGSRKEKVIKVTIYINDIQLWSRVNAVYAAFFVSHKPARAMIPCGELHHGFLIELEAVAAVE